VTELELFHVDSVVPEQEPIEKLSADRRRTLRQKADVSVGRHPLTRGKARPDLGTCGDCRFRVIYSRFPRIYPKCVGHGGIYDTRSAASDVRAWWPACERFEPGDPISDDAARWTPAHAERDS
jgi:hypothetical protein